MTSKSIDIPKTAILAFLFITSTAFGSGGGVPHHGVSFEADYDIGKKVFLEKVICDSCPHAGLELDRDQVVAILPDLQRKGVIGKYLSLRDRKSVNLFVEKRFGL